MSFEEGAITMISSENSVNIICMALNVAATHSNCVGVIKYRVADVKRQQQENVSACIRIFS